MATLSGKILRAISLILSTAILIFFLIFIIGEGILALQSSNLKALANDEIILFIFLFLSLGGLIVSYFKTMTGGIITLCGSIGFIVYEGINSNGDFIPLTKGFPFYFLVFCGLLNIIASLQVRKKAYPPPE